MKRSIVITSAAIAATVFTAGAAFAQSYGAVNQSGDMSATTAPSMAPQSMAPQMNSAASADSTFVTRAAPAPMASSATSMGVNASATAPQVIQLDSSSPMATLVSSKPIPDTPENRALYGGPESNGGKATKPAAN